MQEELVLSGFERDKSDEIRVDSPGRARIGKGKRSSLPQDQDRHSFVTPTTADAPHSVHRGSHNPTSNTDS